MWPKSNSMSKFSEEELLNCYKYSFFTMKIVICWNEEFRKYKKFFHFRYFEFRKFRNSKISKILKIPKILFSIFAISKLENFENIENFRHFRFSRPRKFRKYSVIFVEFSSKIGRKRKYLLENENGFSRKYGNPILNSQDTRHTLYNTHKTPRDIIKSRQTDFIQ